MKGPRWAWAWAWTGPRKVFVGGPRIASDGGPPAGYGGDCCRRREISIGVADAATGWLWMAPPSAMPAKKAKQDGRHEGAPDAVSIQLHQADMCVLSSVSSENE